MSLNTYGVQLEEGDEGFPALSISVSSSRRGPSPARLPTRDLGALGVFAVLHAPLIDCGRSTVLRQSVSTHETRENR